MTLTPLQAAILQGSRVEVMRQIQSALDSGVGGREILVQMIAAMDEVGRRYQCNEVFVPEMLLSARAMKEGMKLLEPVLQQTGYHPTVKIVIGTVQGDMHDIGKNLVIMMLKGAGFQVVDLGVDISPEKFITAVNSYHPTVVGLSGGLTTALPVLKSTVTALRSMNSNPVKIIVGGAPVTEQFALDIGADGYAPDAVSTVELVRKITSDLRTGSVPDPNKL